MACIFTISINTFMSKKPYTAEEKLAVIAPYMYPKGASGYHTWLAKLTPTEREAHLQSRKERKLMRRAMKEKLEEASEYWIASLSKAAQVQVEKAIIRGDTNAFQATWDRIVGKPESTVDVTVAATDSVDDIISQLQEAISLEELTKETNDKENPTT